jgi:hypothetical protein
MPFKLFNIWHIGYFVCFLKQVDTFYDYFGKHFIAGEREVFFESAQKFDLHSLMI